MADRVVLLKLADWAKQAIADGSDLCIAIVVDDYGREPDPASQRYWYNESTCPRNTLRYTELVFLREPGGTGQTLVDEHGLFEYQGCAPLPTPTISSGVAHDMNTRDYRSYYEAVKPFLKGEVK